MPERIFEQNGPIGLYCLETNGLPVQDSNKWNLVGKMIELLSKFEELARRLSKRRVLFQTLFQILDLLKYI